VVAAATRRLPRQPRRSALWRRPDDVTQAALREKAAFFRGMNIVLNQPFFSAKALERALEQPTEEQ
jgi:hypothetical protein